MVKVYSIFLEQGIYYYLEELGLLRGNGTTIKFYRNNRMVFFLLLLHSIHNSIHSTPPYIIPSQNERKREEKNTRKPDPEEGRWRKGRRPATRHPLPTTHPALLSEVGAHQPAILRGVEDVPTGGALSAGTFPSRGCRGIDPSCCSPTVHSCGHPAYRALHQSP